MKPVHTANEKRGGLLREAASLVCFLLSAVLLVLLFQAFIGQWMRVDGVSMEGTLHDGEMVWVSRLGGDYQRGEIVICRFPGQSSEILPLGASLSLSRHSLYIKRLVALPGDSVQVMGGQLYVNGVPAADPPALASLPRDYPLRVLGENEYFVMGDNRALSLDSRDASVGPLSGEMLLGRVTRVIWPFSSICRPA